LTSAEAEAKAADENRVLRVAREDDELFAHTDDLRDGRANIQLDDGIVTFGWIESIEGPMDREGAEDPGDLVYVGLTEAEVVARGADEGHIVRVISRDGEGLAATMDYRPDRRNLDVIDGVVVAVTRG